MDGYVTLHLRLRRAGCWWLGVGLVASMLSITTAAAQAETLTVTPPGTFAQLSVGYDYGCALTPAGAAGCWGEDYGSSATPASVPGPYREVSVGDYASCGLRDDHAIDCWGQYISTSSAHIPGDFRSVSVGSEVVCGIQSNGDLVCLKIDEDGYDHWPTHVVGPFSSLSADWDVCAVDAARDVLCWDGEKARPKRTAGPFTAVSVGSGHTCALRVDRDIACWGENGEGQAPATVAGPFAVLAAGDEATCAIEVGQDLTCWGASDPRKWSRDHSWR